MKPRILTIDDEANWRENFKAWIPVDIAAQDSATTTQEAINLLRRYRYDVVLLDLSMDINNPFNRDNQVIQEYLATWPEGTRYIIVSGTADKTDVRDAAFYQQASDVIFKAEVEPPLLKEKVTKVIEEASKQNNTLVADAWKKLSNAAGLNEQILTTLAPKEGFSGLSSMTKTMFHVIAPVALHKDRPHFAVWNDCVVGLAWSRQLGTAVSMVLASANLPEEKAVSQLEDWLGFSHHHGPILKREGNRIHIHVFEEPSVSDAHFDLPNIHLPNA